MDSRVGRFSLFRGICESVADAMRLDSDNDMECVTVVMAVSCHTLPGINGARGSSLQIAILTKHGLTRSGRVQPGCGARLGGQTVCRIPQSSYWTPQVFGFFAAVGIFRTYHGLYTYQPDGAMAMPTRYLVHLTTSSGSQDMIRYIGGCFA